MIERIICFFVGHDWYYTEGYVTDARKCRYCYKFEEL